MSAEHGGTLREAIATTPLFEGLAAQHQEAIAAHSRADSICAGHRLFPRGTAASGMYLVRSGLMQLSVSNADGAVKVLEILGPGTSFGQAAMLIGARFPVDAIAIEASELVFVPRHAVDALLDSEPEMARVMLASMARRLQSKIQDIAMLSLHSAAQRIAAFLLGAYGMESFDLGDGTGAGDRAGTPSITGAGVELPVLKHVLASRLGMTPETFSRALRTLAEAGMVRVEGAQIRLVDPEALAAYLANG